jgi:chemotaxis protein methyltransferase CheR
MLLDELTPLRRHMLIATDLDWGALEKARARGPFLSQEIQHLSPTLLARYFEPGGPPFFIDKSLARRVQFREHNLLTDEFEGDFDLILCRNVAIYFANGAKNLLYQRLRAALRPGGVLLLGSTELIPSAPETGWQSCGFSLYRKV